MSVEPGRASSRAGWYRFTIRSQIRHICGLTLALLALLGTTPAGAATGIVAIGDFGVGGAWQRGTGASVERFAERREADALITLGDNDYTESPPSFRANWLDSFGWAAADGLLVAGTLGNHDVRVRRGPLRVRAPRDAGTLLPATARQTSSSSCSTRTASAATSSSGSKPPRLLHRRWKVVAMHHPAYSCGGYLGDAARAKPARPGLRAGRRRPRARRPRPQLPALRATQRRDVRRARRRGRRALLAPARAPRRFRRVSRPASSTAGSTSAPTHDSLRVRAISRQGEVLDRFRIYP